MQGSLLRIRSGSGTQVSVDTYFDQGDQPLRRKSPTLESLGRRPKFRVSVSSHWNPFMDRSASGSQDTTFNPHYHHEWDTPTPGFPSATDRGSGVSRKERSGS